ncbi:hypothetical protein PQX77_019536 [Marasmius sp. AFHP31]|nr:hypothetical protein PQX77_019536 [Marasmius sp. AFHP31]
MTPANTDTSRPQIFKALNVLYRKVTKHMKDTLEGLTGQTSNIGTVVGDSLRQITESCETSAGLMKAHVFENEEEYVAYMTDLEDLFTTMMDQLQWLHQQQLRNLFDSECRSLKYSNPHSDPKPSSQRITF